MGGQTNDQVYERGESMKTVQISRETVGKDMLKDLPVGLDRRIRSASQFTRTVFGLYVFYRDSFFFSPLYMRLSMFFACYLTQAKP